MNFKEFFKEISQRTGPAYGAGPSGFKRLLKRLGQPQRLYKIIHVAGTNGKGSVCYLTAQVLQEAGYKTGIFISPHLQSPTERIQLNGCPVSKQVFIRLCQTVLAAEEKSLNFFEILTAAAFLYFAEQKVTYAVLETGLGGRKDPTNVCVPVASVITSIGLDHCAVLGYSLAEIAREKAGIIKHAVPVFCPPVARQAMQEIRRIATSKQAPLQVVRVGHPFHLKKIDWGQACLRLQKQKTSWKLSLLGEKQPQNACLVYHVCRQLGIAETALKKGFARVSVPGRFEVMRFGRQTILIDGAHNPQAIAHLVRFIRQSPWRNPAVVCGFMQDKDYPAMLRVLERYFSDIYITVPKSPRAATRKQLYSALSRPQQAHFYQSPRQAIQAARQTHKSILVCGSFYLAGQLRLQRGRV